MTKLCPRGIAAAKKKYKVYPSAYANGYAVQVCKGMMPDVNDKKEVSPGYTKGKKRTATKKLTATKKRTTTKRKRATSKKKK